MGLVSPALALEYAEEYRGYTTAADQQYRDSGSGLVRITIPSKVTSLGDKAFYNSALSKINIPDSVISIGENAFAETDLSSVVLPSSLTNIKAGTFYRCSLTSITIPDSIIGIAYNAFFCDLENVYYTGSAQQWADIAIADGNGDLTSATIHYNSTGD